MKKLFTLMLAFACALFVGVSCTTDDTIGDTLIPTIPVVKVNGLVIGTPNAGTCDLAYVIENAQDGVDVKVEVDEKGAEWLTAEAVDEKVVLTYTENLTDKSRVATLYLSYGAAETVHVTVKQVGQVYLEVADVPATATYELDPFGTLYAEKLVLNYVMHTEAKDAELSVNVSAAWLKAEVSAEAVTVSYDGNATDAAREATIELSFEGAEPVVLTVKQAVAVPVLTVTGAPEANVDGKGGSFNLTCEIDKVADIKLGVEVSTEATWLHIGELAEDGETYPITVDANLNDPGTEPREAVIKFAYKNADDVLITVKQDPQPAMFSFACDPATLTCSAAAVMVSPVDAEMLYLAVTSQDLEQYSVMGETKEELMNNYMSLLASNNMLYGKPDYWFVYQGNMADAGAAKTATRWDAEGKVTVYAVGFVPTETVTEEDMIFATAAKFVTPISVYEVPFLAYPVVTVDSEKLSHTVASAAGEVVIDWKLENAIEGTEFYIESSAAWATATWADNKLTVKYEENALPVARQAKISVSYGDYVRPVEVTILQEKNATAEPATTLKVTVKGTQFNGILVDVESSNADVVYALTYTKYEENINWMETAEQLLGKKNEQIFHKGNLTDYLVKTNIGNYQWYGYDYCVYAVAVDATSEEMTNSYTGQTYTQWNVTQILTDVVASEKVTIDDSKMPAVTWDLEKSGLVLNDKGYYARDVEENSTVVLYFKVENPAEGASLKLNGTTLSDSFDVVDGEPVIDNEAGTITFKIDAFDASKTYHYVRPGFKYTNAEDDMWNIVTPDLQLNHVQAAAPAPEA